MKTISLTEDATARKSRAQASYRAALHRQRRGLQDMPWATWILTCGTTAIWCFTAYQVARATGTHDLRDILTNIVNNAINVQPRDENALTNVLVTYGAKDNPLIVQGQYWRFITPIFLHVNVLHIGLNMLNLFVLGIYLERIFGHLRFLLIYLVTGCVSMLASFLFAPQEVSVGASGAIFGLVGAYSIFVLMHRRAFPNGGAMAMLWLVVVIGINLGIGFLMQDVDNYAHLGGLLSGCVLGWEFSPLYRLSATRSWQDTHSLARRWWLAVLTILGTLLLAIIALYLNRMRS